MGQGQGGRQRWKRRRYEWAMWARYVEQLTPEAALAWADGDEESEVDWGLVERPHEFTLSASRPAVLSARRRGSFYGRWRGLRARRRPRTSTTGVRWCGGSTSSSA
jgi:hypothetical protein